MNVLKVLLIPFLAHHCVLLYFIVMGAVPGLYHCGHSYVCSLQSVSKDLAVTGNLNATVDHTNSHCNENSSTLLVLTFQADPDYNHSLTFQFNEVSFISLSMKCCYILLSEQLRRRTVMSLRQF